MGLETMIQDGLDYYLAGLGEWEAASKAYNSDDLTEDDVRYLAILGLAELIRVETKRFRGAVQSDGTGEIDTSSEKVRSGRYQLRTQPGEGAAGFYSLSRFVYTSFDGVTRSCLNWTLEDAEYFARIWAAQERGIGSRRRFADMVTKALKSKPEGTTVSKLTVNTLKRLDSAAAEALLGTL